MTAEMPPTPDPNAGARPGYIPYERIEEARAMAEAEHPIREAARIVIESELGTIDPDALRYTLGATAREASRQYRANPDGYIFDQDRRDLVEDEMERTAAYYADANAGGEPEPMPAAAAAPEAGERRLDPGRFAKRVAISLVYFADSRVINTINKRWSQLEDARGIPTITPRIDPSQLVVDDLVHESVVADLATDDRKRTLDHAEAFGIEVKSDKRNTDDEQDDIDIDVAEDRDADEETQRPLVAEVAYVAGSRRDERFRVTMFMSTEQLYELQDALDADPRFLRNVLLSVMPPKMKAATEGWFGQIDLTKSVLRFADRTTKGGAEEYEIPRAA